MKIDDHVPTEQQIAAVRMVQENRISILTGGPGTGKTFTIKKILEWAVSRSKRTLLMAPTGKAAKRMIESTGYAASTIHSALKCVFDELEGGFIFNHNEFNPLPADLVIVDETSMVDNNLMASLLRAIKVGTKVLLVGDSDQLPSVGPGQVLHDLLESGKIPHTELNIIHRNTGTIVKNCACIRNGEVYEPEKSFDLKADDPVNMIHCEINTIDEILNAIKSIVTKRMPLRGFNSLWEVQVISPVNTRTAISCKGINEVLQKELNLLYDKEKDSKFFPGDKVINTKNAKAIMIDQNETYIVNGDIGKVLEVEDKGKIIVEFYDPLRQVYMGENKNNLLHAYAITCHRMQGSEAPVVVMPVHTTFSYSTSRRWLYTAVSRAKTACITVGHFSAIEKMILSKRETYRNTRLKDHIIEEMEEI